MDMEKIEFTSNDDTSSRTERLHRVLGYVAALADHYNNTHVLNKLHGLHDHKGILEVKWTEKPTDGEKEWFKQAWESQIGDGCDSVDHIIQSA